MEQKGKGMCLYRISDFTQGVYCSIIHFELNEGDTDMVNLLEAFMVICFGISWPLNIIKAWRARSTKGMSLLFYCFIWLGYIFGITSKVVRSVSEQLRFLEVSPVYVWFFYILNALMVSVGIAIYFRNKHIESSASEDMERDPVVIGQLKQREL